jgi:hypothetical protein
VLVFEFFPAVLAAVGAIVAVVLFRANRRAARDPLHLEAPRAPSKPDVTPEEAASEANTRVRRPSMNP